MLLDKISVLNDCLIATGNNSVALDDGSAEWVVASNAFDRMLSVVLYKHNWVFQTTTANLARIGASAYPGYSDIYQRPPDCLHLENAWRTDVALLIQPSQSGGFGRDGMGSIPPQLDYKIIGDQIHCVAPSGVTALYVIDPASHSNVILDVTPGILETLRREIESLLYQGLNEDAAGAAMTKRLAATEISEARAKVDSESPRRVAFRSGFTRIRRGSIGGIYGGVSSSSTTPATPAVPATPAATLVIITTSPYSVLTAGTYIVRKAAGSATSVVLPASPTSGMLVIVKDGKGDAAANNITITAAGGVLVDGSASYVMAINYVSASFLFDGVQWNIL